MAEGTKDYHARSYPTHSPLTPREGLTTTGDRQQSDGDGENKFKIIAQINTE